MEFCTKLAASALFNSACEPPNAGTSVSVAAGSARERSSELLFAIEIISGFCITGLIRKFSAAIAPIPENNGTNSSAPTNRAAANLITDDFST